MPQDFGEMPNELGKKKMPRDWRAWVTSPGRLAGTAAGIGVLGFLLGYLITTLAVYPSQNVASGLVRVPNVVGMTAEDAQTAVGESDLEYEEAAGLNHSEPPGTVVAQEPLPEQMAPPNSTVRVTLSMGARERPVPDVVGLNRDQAEIVLTRAGYVTDIVWVDAENDVEQVVGMRPAAGTAIKVSGSVQLLVSAGPRTPDVPDLSTSSLDEAREALDRLGLRLGEVTERPDSLAAPGTVLSQSPQPGSVLDRGAAVSVVVAVVPPPDTVGVVEDTVGMR